MADLEAVLADVSDADDDVHQFDWLHQELFLSPSCTKMDAEKQLLFKFSLFLMQQCISKRNKRKQLQ